MNSPNLVDGSSMSANQNHLHSLEKQFKIGDSNYLSDFSKGQLWQEIISLRKQLASKDCAM